MQVEAATVTDNKAEIGKKTNEIGVCRYVPSFFSQDSILLMNVVKYSLDTICP